MNKNEKFVWYHVKEIKTYKAEGSIGKWNECIQCVRAQKLRNEINQRVRTYYYMYQHTMDTEPIIPKWHEL
jgi:hypothetical protein